MSYPFDYKQVSGLSSEEMFSVIEDWLNTGGERKQKEFALALCRTHRTLQQLFVGLVFKTLLDYARKNPNKFSDARNEASVELCHKLLALVESGELSEYFPYI